MLYEVIALLIFFFLIMLTITIKKNDQTSKDSFLVASRKVKPFPAALSLAVSWVWAPAIFVSSMQAYLHGLAGIFWFTLPNILCFFIFIPVAKKFKKDNPRAYTFPEYISNKYGNTSLHLLFVFFFILNQSFGIIVNAVAGGILINLLTGLNTSLAIIIMTLIALSYSYFAGLKASIITDGIQMAMILGIAACLVPLCLVSFNELDMPLTLSGISGIYGSVFNPYIAFTLGIPMTITLLTGPLSDQMFYQRVLAVEEKQLSKIFIRAGLIFGLVPVMLAVLGFIGASLFNAQLITVSDPQLISAETIKYLLPAPFLFAFCLMVFAGLCSTMDSALCAFSALMSIDIYKKYFNKEADDRKILYKAKQFMLLLAFMSLSISLLQPKLMWLFLCYGTFAAAITIPVTFSLFNKQVAAKQLSKMIYISIVFGLPVSIYVNINEMDTMIPIVSLIALLLGWLIYKLSQLKLQLMS